MSQNTILVIDDSSTIRRLVDSELSAAGFRVVLAATAEEGLQKAAEERPNLILLDHQLPGTTGLDVSRQLLESPQLAQIPVVVSSTLRKKAYAEYVDAPNVVDMLPKPYTSELLITTVENAIHTAAMVVQSQNAGSAVPETIHALSEAALSGNFACFNLREVIDLLNNGSKCGVLEIETERCRVWIYVDKGRIQAVTAVGIDPAHVTRHMPASLAELAPVINFTVGGRRCSEIDGLVELLDNKVLDPRLLRKLLRLQAAILLQICFTTPLKSFRFESQALAPPLFRKLPLDMSLLALLVEGSLVCDENSLPQLNPETRFKRGAIRGQNLDRAGLSSQHMKLMGLLSESMTIQQISSRLGWEFAEARRVLHAFELAELVQRQQVEFKPTVIAVATDSQQVRWLQQVFDTQQDRMSGKVVKDWLAAGLLLRRNKPNALLVSLDNELTMAQVQKLRSEPSLPLAQMRIIGLLPPNSQIPPRSAEGHVDCVLQLPASEEQLLQEILCQRQSAPERPAGNRPGSNPVTTTQVPLCLEASHVECF